MEPLAGIAFDCCCLTARQRVRSYSIIHEDRLIGFCSNPRWSRTVVQPARKLEDACRTHNFFFDGPDVDRMRGVILASRTLVVRCKAPFLAPDPSPLQSIAHHGISAFFVPSWCAAGSPMPGTSVVACTIEERVENVATCVFDFSPSSLPQINKESILHSRKIAFLPTTLQDIKLPWSLSIACSFQALLLLLYLESGG